MLGLFGLMPVRISCSSCSLANAVQHVLPEFLPFYRFLGLTHATFFPTDDHSHLQRCSAITLQFVVDTFLSLRHE